MVNQKTLMKVAGVIPFLFIRQSALSPVSGLAFRAYQGLGLRLRGFRVRVLQGLGGRFAGYSARIRVRRVGFRVRVRFLGLGLGLHGLGLQRLGVLA